MARAWIDLCGRHRDALAELFGTDEVDQRHRERRIQLGAVEDGLLRRTLLVAVRPNVDDRPSMNTTSAP